MATCELCGAVREGEDPTWSCEHDGRRTRWLCPPCTRSHVRDIEAKLAPEWW